MNLKNAFSSFYVGPSHDDSTIESSWPKQGWIKNVRTVGRGDQNDAFVRFKPIHFDEQLIQRLLPLGSRVRVASLPPTEVPQFRILCCLIGREAGNQERSFAARSLLRLGGISANPCKEQLSASRSKRDKTRERRKQVKRSVASGRQSWVAMMPGRRSAGGVGRSRSIVSQI